MGYWLTRQDIDEDEFRRVTSEATRAEDHPHCVDIRSGIPVYDGRALPTVADPDARRALMAEIGTSLLHGPGVVCVTAAVPDISILDRVSDFYTGVIEQQRLSGGAGGDHFGHNDRIWNSLEKLATRRPDLYVDYFSNDALALVAEAWLGPGYLMTSQVNLVRPGSAAQVLHRDYHLGFQQREMLERYPGHVHTLSPALTLQVGVAHMDMPLVSGPTVFVPHSQKFSTGYLVSGDERIAAVAEERAVQLALRKGDIVFFNPAVIHGAGHNASADIDRLANLLQISSPFGRPMEAVDHTRIVTAVYPELLDAKRRGARADLLANAVAASTDGYPFPTNLDLDQPIGGLAPQSQRDVVLDALEADLSLDLLARQLSDHAQRRIA